MRSTNNPSAGTVEGSKRSAWPVRILVIGSTLGVMVILFWTIFIFPATLRVSDNGDQTNDVSPANCAIPSVAYQQVRSDGHAEVQFPQRGAVLTTNTRPFTWTQSAGATEYYLTIGTSQGERDVFDGGSVEATRQFVYNLTDYPALNLHIRLYTSYDGETWNHTDSEFRWNPMPIQTTETNEMELRNLVMACTKAVREMADVGNRPHHPLLDLYLSREDKTASCTEYSRALVHILTENGVAAQTRDTTFTGTAYESHTFVEFSDTSGRWLPTDPTFGVIFSDGSKWWTTDELSAEVKSGSFANLPWIHVSTGGSDYSLAYYMDPRLLYMNPLPLNEEVRQEPVPQMTFLEPGEIEESLTVIARFVGFSGEAALEWPDGRTQILTPLSGTEWSQAVIVPDGTRLTGEVEWFSLPRYAGGHGQ